jgi:5-methylcytosine-specific restriction endonuclease McrA
MTSRTLRSKTKRNALFIYHQGLCAMCSEPLDETWEADHIKPFSLTGETNIHDMQATCRPCNRKKGAKYES